MKLSQDVHDALTRAGGTNYLGQPIYKFAWSGTETRTISNGRDYEEFRIVAEDCWILMKWDAPDSEQLGTKEAWERDNWEPSGLYTAGPYPTMGRYRVLNKLIKMEIKDDVMSWVPFTPDRKYVEEVFPGVQAFQELTTEQKRNFLVERDKAEKAELAKKFAKSRENYRGVATGRQVADKVAAIERWYKNPKNQELARSVARKREK